MKALTVIGMFVGLVAVAGAAVLYVFRPKTTLATPGAVEGTLYDFTMPDIEGQDKPLADFKGKVVLVVNVASRCGLTPQYEGLEALYQSHREQGLVVLGFPANNFGNQEPGTNEEIQQFCTSKYNVSFPMFAKISVGGDDQAPLYKWLIAATGGDEIQWNFEKFLIGRDGQVIARFSPRVKPDDPEFVAAVEKALGEGR